MRAPSPGLGATETRCATPPSRDRRLRLGRSIARTTAALALAGAALAAAVVAAEGQEQRREGFWIGFGAGGGINTSESLDDSRRGGGALYLRLGGTPSQKVLLGGELIGWGREDDDSSVVRGNATFSVLFYPNDGGGFFLKGGLGGSSLEVTRNGTTETENGFGATAGLGFDIQLSRKLSLTPNADWLFQAFDAGPDLASTNTLLLFTVGLTFH